MKIQLHTTSEIIDQLGGPTRLADELGLSSHVVVCNWRRRGVAWPYRMKVAQMLGDRGFAPPDGFLEPKDGHDERSER